MLTIVVSSLNTWLPQHVFHHGEMAASALVILCYPTNFNLFLCRQIKIPTASSLFPEFPQQRSFAIIVCTLLSFLFLVILSFLPNFCYIDYAVPQFDMEKQNADLFWENCRIMLENEKLKMKAEKLKQENQILAAEVRMHLEPENSNATPNKAESSSSANKRNKNQGRGKSM